MILRFPQKKRYEITIPKSLVLAKGWKERDVLKWKIGVKGEIVLEKNANGKTLQNSNSSRAVEERRQQLQEKAAKGLEKE